MTTVNPSTGAGGQGGAGGGATMRLLPKAIPDPDRVAVICTLLVTGVIVYVVLDTHRLHKRHSRETHAAIIGRYTSDRPSDPAAESAPPVVPIRPAGRIPPTGGPDPEPAQDGGGPDADAPPSA